MVDDLMDMVDVVDEEEYSDLMDMVDEEAYIFRPDGPGETHSLVPKSSMSPQ